MTINKPNNATVSDILQMMAQLEAEGIGHYIVTCNGEYTLARKNEIPNVDNSRCIVDLGGYDN